MSAKFTPGPWLHEGTSVYALNDDGFNRFSALVQTGHLDSERWTSLTEIKANVVLMAAAPDLFNVVDMLMKSFTAAGLAADCDSNDPAEVLMCKAMRAWLKAGAV